MPFKKLKTDGLRYVIYSPTRGIYLGESRWSKDPWAKKIQSAPTYPNTSRDADAIRITTPDLELRQVFASAEDGKKATKEDCANALLPIW